MSTISITCTDQQINKIKTTFFENIVTKTPPYALFQCKLDGCVITAYQSKKVVFQGNDAELFAASFLGNTGFTTQAGSDEVGTGDYFGPICVCACVVTEENYKKLSQYDIQDSKAISDEVILKVAPIVMKECQYSLLILNNTKYNQVHLKNNMNQIKAKLHNQAYFNLSKKCELPKLSVVDQFAPENLYYSYLKNETNIIKGLHFETKAESKYFAVACASMIARYAFLDSLSKYEDHYKMTLLKGASDAVDKNAAQFVEKYGFSELQHIAKMHFKNTEKVKLLLNDKI